MKIKYYKFDARYNKIQNRCRFSPYTLELIKSYDTNNLQDIYRYRTIWL